MAKPENAGAKRGRGDKGRRRKGTSGNPAGRAKGKTPTPFAHRTPEEPPLVNESRDPPRLTRPPKFKKRNNGQEAIPDAQDVRLWFARLKQALGIDDTDLVAHLVHQVVNVIFKENEATAFNHALAAIHGMGPRDTLEGLLAVQMVATHNAGMEMLRRAMVPDQTFEGCNAAVNQATKLLRTFTAQMEALSRYRGKGQQKMTVEHVHVHEGGQAIVGQVNREKARAKGTPSKTEV